jgi:putative ABC transport system permease protein
MIATSLLHRLTDVSGVQTVLGTLAACLVVAALVGMLAGAWPAWRASRLRILDALSYE